MKKRILALLLALVLTVSCLPPVALAEEVQSPENTQQELLPQEEPVQPQEEETAPVLLAAHGAHTCEHCADSAVVWTAWDKTDSLPTSGHYYLTAPVTLENWTTLDSASDELSLCLNGQSITAAKRAFRMSNGAKLTVSDCTGTGKIFAGASNGGAVGIFRDKSTDAPCVLNMYNITVEGVAGKVPQQGGAVSCSNGASAVTLKGVTFRNLNIAGGTGGTTGGAAVYMTEGTANGSALYMENCTVTGCTDSSPATAAGAVRCLQVKTVTIKNCSFTGNTAKGGTGASAIMLSGGNVTMSGCTVTGNTCTATSEWCGGIYVYSATQLTLSGKNTINGNTINNGAKEANLVLQESAANAADGNLHFADVDPTSVLKIKAKRSTTDPNKLMNVTSGGTFTITYEHTGDFYRYDTASKKFVLGHQHADGYAAAPAGAVWQPWTAADSLPTTAGYWYLTENVQLTSRYAEIKNEDVFVCLNGKTVTAKAKGTDGLGTNAWRMTGSGDLTVCDCSAHTDGGVYTAGKLTGGTMGALYTMSTASGTYKLYDGILSGNAGDSGAAVVIQGSAAFHMYGGEISGNTATANGGAIYNGGSVGSTIHGGTISNNEAGGKGGAIYSVTTLNISGGIITGNKAATSGGGIHANGGVLKLSGSPRITGNTVSDVANNVYLPLQKILTLGEMGTGTKQVGINVDTSTLPRAISSDMGEDDYSGYFFCDDEDYFIEKKDGKLYMDKIYVHIHDDEYAGVDESVVWQAWEKTDSLPTAAGYWYLTENVTLTSRFAEIKTDEVYVCLNGKTVTAKAKGTDGLGTNAWRLTGAGKLTVCDCTAHEDASGNYVAGKLTGSCMGAVYTMNNVGATVNFYDGIISGNTADGTNSGAAIVIQKGSTLNLYGGLLTGNQAGNNGGAIYNAGTTYIYGGELSGNKAAAIGGAVYSVSDLYIRGDVVITGNEAVTSGGGVFSGGGVMGISGSPEIKGNTVAGAEHNLYLATGKVITLGTVGTGTAKVGVSVAANTLPRFLSGDMGTADCTAYFFADNAEYEIIKKDNKLYLQVIYKHVHDHEYAGVDGSVVWQAWEKTDSLPNTAGYWYLTENVTLTSRFAEIKTDEVFVCLNGYTVTSKARGTDGLGTSAWRITGAGKLTVCDCTAHTDASGNYVAGKLTGSTMGAIYTMNKVGATVNFYDGIISGNVTGGGDSGAAIVIQAGNTLNLYGGLLTGNTSVNNAGAVYNAGTANIYGGTITGNTAGTMGGGIYTAGILNIHGGVITGNNAMTSGGGIHVNAGEISLAGAPQIKNNTVAGAASNLYLPGDKILALGKVETGTAQVGISVDTSKLPRFVSTQMVDGDCSGYFFSDDPFRVIIARNNRLYIGNNDNHKHCDCNGIGGEHCEHDKQPWGAWVDADSLPTSGRWYLETDVTVADVNGITTTGDLQLCLNGHTVDGDGHVILKIRSDEHNVVITDCEAGGQIINGSAKDYGAIYVEKGSFTMFGGRLADHHNTQTTAGGWSGGAIHARGTAQIKLISVQILDNSSTAEGGAICLRESGSNGATAYLESCTFKNNSAQKSGGAIYANSALNTVTIKNCIFEGNTSEADGGAILIRGGELTVESGTFQGNTAKNAGGAILVQSGGNLTLKDGIFTGNAATETSGGAIYISTGSSMTMDGGEISGNTAKLYGAGIHLLGATFTMNGGKVTGNSAEAGAGISAMAAVRTVDGQSVRDIGVTAVINDGIISGNTAATNGGGLQIAGQNTTLTLKGGQITENTAANGGGILVMDKATVTQSGGQINKNTASTNGGGVYVSYGCGLTQAGGEISENIANSHGGGIYLLGSRFQKTGGKVNKNTAAVQGGGIFATYRVDGNTTFTSLIDIQGGDMYTNKAPDGAAIATIRNTQVKLSGGYIMENEASGSAAGILLQTGSTMTMTGGLIAKNKAVNEAGGVYVSTGCSLVMNEGKITENVAGTLGGGVVLLGSKFEMNAGTIYGNSAKSGGGVYAKSGSRSVDGKTVSDVGATFLFKGGNFSTNTATSDGGGVVTRGKNTEFILDGGYLQKNTAPSGGGALAIVESKITVKSGTMTANTSKNSGGGIFMSYSTELNVEGGDIYKNEAGSHGGGIYLLGSKLTVKGGMISSNTAKVQGGGIFATYKEVENGPTYKSEINIRGGRISGNQAPDGAGIATIRYTKVNMSGGSVTGNKASKSAGGMLLQTGSSLQLSGGSVSSNVAQKDSAGGIFISSKCSITMTGGAVSSNTCKGYAGGIYLMHATGSFTGGKIQGNKATQYEAGGLYVRGSKVTLDGTDILDNYAKKSGGGIVTVRYVAESKGIDAQPELVIKSGRIANNHSDGVGGGMLLQSKAETKMLGGSIENNYCKSYGGGVYVSMNHTFTVTGGKITNNESDGWGGGIYHLRGSVGNYENFELSYNKAASLGGGMIINGTEAMPSAVTMKKVEVIGNEAREGAGVRTQDRFQSFQAEKCNFKENKATSFAGGLMIFFGLQGVRVKDCVFENNTSGTQGAGVYVMSALKDCEITGCTFKGNVAGTEGGGMWTQGGFLLKDCVFDDNHAGLEGGAIATDVFANTRVRHPVLYVEGCVISNNTSGTNGGGIYADTASYISVSDTEITGNSSKAEGGGMWIVDDSTLHNVTVTGNRSGGEGYALYYHASEYDGLSYIRGAHKIGGDMIVRDNEGGDMYMGEQTGIAVSDKGLTGNTYMTVRLHSGYLTQLLRGAYNYEGGDTVYTVTAGNRSLTEPEVFAFGNAVPVTEDEGEGLKLAPVVWVGGGALVVAIIAIAVLILLVLGKKKKAAAGK